MKNTIKMIGSTQPSRRAAKVPLLIIALVVITVVSYTACGNGSTTDPLPVPRDGAWINGSATVRIIFNGTDYTQLDGEEKNVSKGTFSVSGNIITITITHHWNDGVWKEELPPNDLSGSITKQDDYHFTLSDMGGGLDGYYHIQP